MRAPHIQEIHEIPVMQDEMKPKPAVRSGKPYHKLDESVDRKGDEVESMEDIELKNEVEDLLANDDAVAILDGEVPIEGTMQLEID